MAKQPQPRVTWGERALALLDSDDPATELSKVRAFEWIFVLIVCTEYWARGIPKWNDLGLTYWITLALFLSPSKGEGWGGGEVRWLAERQRGFSGVSVSR